MMNSPVSCLKWKPLLATLLAAALLLAACQSPDLPAPEAENANPPSEETAEPSAADAGPLAVTEAFYTWYLNYEGNAMVDAAYRDSPYLTSSYVGKVEAIIADFDRGGYDPFLMAQDIPQEISFESWEEDGDAACVVVHEQWPGSPPHDLTVDLIKENGAWKIDNVRMGSPMTPKGVTRLFYQWYISYAREEGNPLVDGVYRESEFLSPAFVEKVDAILAGFDHAGYDPILQAQDIPVSFTLEEPLVEGDAATVVVQRYWGGNPEPSPMTVHLEKSGRRWLIVDVTAEIPEVAPLSPDMAPEAVVEAFYGAWRASIVGDEGIEQSNPLMEKSYHNSPYLTPALISRVDEIVAGFDRGCYDPFLCAQDVPGRTDAVSTFMNGEVASVVVQTDFPGHAFTVDLVPGDDGWLMNEITCGGTPTGNAKAFYTWYLGYIGDPGSDNFRNPIVSRAYREAPYVSPAFVREIDALLEQQTEEFGGIPADPILLAQDIPRAFTVEPGPTEETAVVNLLFGETLHPRLLSFEQIDGQWLIISIDDPNAPDAATDAPPVLDTTAWQLFVDDQYGYSFKVPAGWVTHELELGGPGMPEDWPQMRSFQIMPAEVAEQMLAQTGPPDPNAPPLIAPFTVSVVAGDQAALDRVYVPAVASEIATINGYEARIERDSLDYTVVRYVFQHRSDPEIWVVFEDLITEFPGREEQAATIQGVLPAILSTFVFE